MCFPVYATHFYQLVNYSLYFLGQFNIPSVNALEKVGTGVWGMALATSAYHSSSDASLFSSSLPVLPHEKCMSELMLEDIAKFLGVWFLRLIFLSVQ